MSSVTVTLSDVRIQKGYQDKPAATFREREGTGRGNINFKVSTKIGENWNNYNIEYNIRSDSKLRDILNAPGTRLSVSGNLTQESYEGNKFLKVRAWNVDLLSKPEGGQQQGQTAGGTATPAPQTQDEEVPF